MKNLIFLAVLLAIGYFTYKYFVVPWLDDFAPAESTTNDYLPPIPQECRVKGEILEDAIYGEEMGKLTMVELNQYTRRFQRCLKDAGFSDTDINGTYDSIKERALNTDPSDLRGWSPKE